MNRKFRINKRKLMGNVLTGVLVLFACTPLFARGGAGAINGAAQTIKDYYDPVEKVIMAIGGLVGFIGGIRIYNKWQNGDQDVNKELMAWGGACIFLLLAPQFIKAFFV